MTNLVEEFSLEIFKIVSYENVNGVREVIISNHYHFNKFGINNTNLNISGNVVIGSKTPSGFSNKSGMLTLTGSSPFTVPTVSPSTTNGSFSGQSVPIINKGLYKTGGLVVGNTTTASKLSGMYYSGSFLGTTKCNKEANVIKDSRMTINKDNCDIDPAELCPECFDLELRMKIAVLQGRKGL
jgi:hypothetical protein